jgi:hypothetical protein
MEQPPLCITRETLLGMPPKVRNAASWGVTEDGTQSQIVALRAFSRADYTYVVFHGSTCHKDGVRNMLSIARFHDTTFCLPKMHHTVLVVVPEDVRVDAFEVSWTNGDTACAMVRLSNDTTYFYPILISAVYLDSPIVVRGNVKVEGARGGVFRPIAPAEAAEGMLAFYGRDDASSRICVLTEHHGQFTVNKSPRLTVGGESFRLSPSKDLLFFSSRGGGIAPLGTGKATGVTFDLPAADDDLVIKDVCVLKTAASEEAGLVVLLGKEGLPCSVRVTIRGEWQAVVLPGDDEPSCIFDGRDGCIYIGTTTAAVHRYALYDLARPLSTQRFPSWVSPTVNGIADGPNGRLFVAADGVLWQTDREVEAQGPRTVLRYVGYFVLVFVLIYATLFIGM